MVWSRLGVTAGQSGAVPGTLSPPLSRRKQTKTAAGADRHTRQRDRAASDSRKAEPTTLAISKPGARFKEGFGGGLSGTGLVETGASKSRAFVARKRGHYASVHLCPPRPVAVPPAGHGGEGRLRGALRGCRRTPCAGPWPGARAASREPGKQKGLACRV